MFSGGDICQNQAICIRVLGDIHHFGDIDLVPLGADVLDLFGFHAGHGHAIGEFFRFEITALEPVPPTCGR